MPAPKSARDILLTELKEIHSAERQMSRAIPKLMRQIQSEELKRMLEQRREQGATIIEELDGIFDEIGASKSRPKNVAIEGLIEDINEHLENIKEPALLDAVMLASMQKVEHYCIAAWGTAASLGRLIGETRTVQLMERLLEEGKQDDREMTELAENEVNRTMLSVSEDA